MARAMRRSRSPRSSRPGVSRPFSRYTTCIKASFFRAIFFFGGGSLLYAHTYICLTADHVVWIRHNEARATKSPTITAAPPRPGRSRSHATYATRDFPRPAHSYLRFGTKNTAQDRRGEAQSNNRGRSARLKRHVYYRTACSSPHKSVACKNSLSPPPSPCPSAHCSFQDYEETKFTLRGRSQEAMVDWVCEIKEMGRAGMQAVSDSGKGKK